MPVVEQLLHSDFCRIEFSVPHAHARARMAMKTRGAPRDQRLKMLSQGHAWNVRNPCASNGKPDNIIPGWVSGQAFVGSEQPNPNLSPGPAPVAQINPQNSTPNNYQNHSSRWDFENYPAEQGPSAFPATDWESVAATAQDNVQNSLQTNSQNHVSGWLKGRVGCGPASQISQQRFGLDQIGKCKSFGEPCIEWGEQMDCLCPAPLAAPEAGETHCRPELE